MIEMETNELENEGHTGNESNEKKAGTDMTAVETKEGEDYQ